MEEDKIPQSVLEYFRQQGARGGRKAAEGMTPEARRDRALKAVTAREQKRAAGELAPKTPKQSASTPQLKCLRCLWEWVSRVSDPRACPGCHSRNWRTPKPIGEHLCEFCGADFKTHRRKQDHKDFCPELHPPDVIERRLANHAANRR